MDLRSQNEGDSRWSSMGFDKKQDMLTSSSDECATTYVKWNRLELPEGDAKGWPSKALGREDYFRWRRRFLVGFQLAKGVAILLRTASDAVSAFKNQYGLTQEQGS